MTKATQTRGRGRKKIDQTELDAANEASRELGKQQQAAKAPAKRTRKTAAKKDTSNGAGKQSQSAGAEMGVEKQGAEASGKSSAPADTSGEIRGGTKQVLITEAPITSRGGRPAGVEEYPFGELTPARKETDGRIVGPSFFIPTSDRAEGRLAAARKRHKALFWSRKVHEQVNGKGQKVEGLRIWRGTPALKKEV